MSIWRAIASCGILLLYSKSNSGVVFTGSFNPIARHGIALFGRYQARCVQIVKLTRSRVPFSIQFLFAGGLICLPDSKKIGTERSSREKKRSNSTKNRAFLIGPESCGDKTERLAYLHASSTKIFSVKKNRLQNN